MKNKLFGLAILIITLVFGMMVLGCDESGGGTSKGGNPSNETVNADGTINMIENKWANGNITSGVGEIVYTFKVSIAKSYNIWWNNANYGDGSKTLNTYVSAYYSDGTSIFNEYYGAWTSPRTFVSTSNNTVYLRVAPFSSGSTGTFAIVYSTSTNKPIVPNLPNVPTEIKASANSANSITIMWNTVSDATGYKIYRSTSSSGSFYETGSSTSNSYTDTGLSSNTTYYYRITAYNNNGAGSQSDTVSATTLIAPNVPTEVKTSDNSANSITITWNTVSDATGYKIYRSTTGSFPFSEIGSSTSNSYTDTGLLFNKVYYYCITAYNSNGESSQSNTTSSVTK